VLVQAKDRPLWTGDVELASGVRATRDVQLRAGGYVEGRVADADGTRYPAFASR
jgi:hypothetical protein